MASDPENPEWTDAGFAAEALPPEFLAAFSNATRKAGRPAETTMSEKERVTLRLDKSTLDQFRAAGPSWQTRINETLRKAVGL